MLSALNASLVGLVAAPVALPPAPDATTAPAVVPRVPWLDPAACAPCLGLGLLRGVDPARRMWLVHTPVPAGALAAACTVLARGALALPPALALAADPAARCPYLSFDFSATADVAGANQRRPRLNLARRRLAGGGGGHVQQ